MIRSKLTWLFLLLASISSSAYAQRIGVSGTQFQVNGNQIWLNGANTPWHNWNDFGTGNYDNSWWESNFQSLANAHINCVRVWISCTGGGININSDGTVTGVTSTFFSDLDQFFALAQKYKVYVLVTTMSFDFFNANESANYQAWRNCVNDPTKVATLASNYITPLVNRYKSNPYFFAVDVCNEPEVAEQTSDDGQIAWSNLQYLVGYVAAAVHNAGGGVLATTGSEGIKWNSTQAGADGNYWSNSALQAQYNNSNAYLDFYETHWYSWQVYWFGDPASSTTPSTYGINDRPNIIGECPAVGMETQDSSGNTIAAENPTDTYEGAYQHGWQGVLAWSSNGVDNNGSLSDFSSGTTAFYNNHPGLVVPSSGSGVTTHSGSYMVEANPAGNWSNLAQNVNVNANSSYTLSFWLQGTGSIHVRVMSSDWSTTLAQGDFTPGSSWNQASLTFNTSGNTVVVLDFTDSTSGGTLYIDDVSCSTSGGSNVVADPGFEDGSGQSSWFIQNPPFSIIQP
ncbi:hypothetical protein GALL_372930 [mine drainage metagenome]|uniref:Uncharacterized protein n=1 Tax=mine drainage metagenome TaxID=410659 RepID=A0A1J5QC13_9ZZZZ